MNSWWVENLEFCKRTTLRFYQKDQYGRWKRPKECIIEGEIVEFLPKGDCVRFEYDDDDGMRRLEVYQVNLVVDKQGVRDKKLIITREIDLLEEGSRGIQ